MLASRDGVARTVTRASRMASPSCEKKKPQTPMSLSPCVASFCSSVGCVVTPPAVSISVSGVTSNRERFVSIDGSVPIEHRVLHVETHHCCTKATASCELNFFSLEKTWVLFCAVRLRAEQRNVHMARAGAAVVEAPLSSGLWQ